MCGYEHPTDEVGRLPKEERRRDSSRKSQSAPAAPLLDGSRPEVAGIAATPSAMRNTFAKRLAASEDPRHHLAEYLGVTGQSASVY